MKRWLATLSAALMFAVPVSPALAQTPVAGPVFTPSGFNGTALTAAGGDISIRIQTFGFNNGSAATSVVHFFAAGANGEVVQRIWDFNGTTITRFGTTTNFIEDTPTGGFSLGTFVAGDVIRFGLVSDGATAPLYTLTQLAPIPFSTYPAYYALTYPAGGNGVGSVRFEIAGVTSTVPEPSTYALMAAGLAVLGVVARRRRTVA